MVEMCFCFYAVFGKRTFNKHRYTCFHCKCVCVYAFGFLMRMNTRARYAFEMRYSKEKPKYQTRRIAIMSGLMLMLFDLYIAIPWR